MISCFEAQKKENLELRTFFKCIADAKERDGKFVRLHNELFELSTVKGDYKILKFCELSKRY